MTASFTPLLQDELREFAQSARGVDYFGVADLSLASDAVRDQSDGILSDFPWAVSIGIALPNAVVDLLPQRKNAAVRISYRTHAYDTVNRRLDLVASELASLVQRRGYAAFPVASSERANDEKICAIFSHKLAAHLSGLGWIGKSCLLITPDRGPRVRWASVLTNAPLQATGTPLPERCGDCTACVDACPVNAFTGRAFRPDEPREARYRAKVCDAYFKAMGQKENAPVCGLCLYTCPYGRQGHASEASAASV
jgi:epoxyqueuosine reductase QueG